MAYTNQQTVKRGIAVGSFRSVIINVINSLWSGYVIFVFQQWFWIHSFGPTYALKRVHRAYRLINVLWLHLFSKHETHIFGHDLQVHTTFFWLEYLCRKQIPVFCHSSATWCLWYRAWNVATKIDAHKEIIKHPCEVVRKITLLMLVQHENKWN